MVAELVMTKNLYGDTVVRLRRTSPMGVAAEIQWSVLPPLTFANRELSVAAALEPAYEVAGDSMDYAVDVDAARFGIFDGVGHDLLSAQLVRLVVAAYRNARRARQTLVQSSLARRTHVLHDVRSPACVLQPVSRHEDLVAHIAQAPPLLTAGSRGRFEREFSRVYPRAAHEPAERWDLPDVNPPRDQQRFADYEQRLVDFFGNALLAK